MKNEDILNDIKIADPCPVAWSTMSGDDKVRFCSMCKLNVYNISNMTSSEAIQTITENEGKVCIQLRRRRDGTIITDNCPVGLRKLRDMAHRCAVFALSGLFWFGLTQDKTFAKGIESDSSAGSYGDAFQSQATMGAIGGGVTLGPQFDAYIKDCQLKAKHQAEKEALEREQRKIRSKLAACRVLIPSTFMLSAIYFLLRKRKRAITEMAIISVSVVTIAGALWGFLSSG